MIRMSPVIGVTPISAIAQTKSNNYNLSNNRNSKNTTKCTVCKNCKDMYCSKKKKRVASIYEAKTCNNFKKADFSTYSQK